jgi:hypothetical protein
MTKERIQELLLEPFGTLSEHERAEIEAFAEKDDEIRQALGQARAFSGVLRKAQLVRDPGPATWTSFLAGVRARIDARTPTIPLWRRQPVLVPVLATALLVLILATGRFGPDFSHDYTNGEIQASVPSLGVLADGPVLTEDDYTSLNELGVDAASVAQALEVEDIELVTEENVPESEMDAPPLIDELLVLSDDEIEGLLADLKATRFM